MSAAMATVKEPPRHVLVNGQRIRFRLGQQIAWATFAGFIGTLVIVALYYIIVQVKYPGLTYGGRHHTALYLKPYWDNLFSWKAWPADRHDIRNVYEGVLAVLFGGTIAANWRRKGGREVRLAPAWYVAISPLVILVAAFPVVVGGIYLLNHLGPQLWADWHLHHVGNPVHFTRVLEWLGTFLAGFPWQPFVIGLIAGRVVRKLYQPAALTVQAHFVGRSVDAARDARDAGSEHWTRKLPRWPMPPGIREQAWWVVENDLPVPNRTTSIRAAVYAVAVFTLGLAAYGGYVKYVIAKGH